VADDGAQEIHSLLVTSSDTLAEAMQKVGDGLHIDDADNADAGDAALHGIRQARQYYARLRRRIRNIHTSADSKRDVLEAIAQLNAGLELFAKGIKAGSTTDKGRDRIADAADQIQNAAVSLNQATKALV
jgi:uncharacterized phage infection (PIP) family protein YhgE